MFSPVFHTRYLYLKMCILSYDREIKRKCAGDLQNFREKPSTDRERCYIPNAYPATDEIMEIVPGIHRVDGVNGNCYLIIRDGITIIDTGLPGASKKILSYIGRRLGASLRISALSS